MKRCQLCVLDDRYPGITFDTDGVCKFCTSTKKNDDRKKTREKFNSKFKALVDQHKGRGVYDCLVAYSGGKDSTFTLHWLKTICNLKILAFTFDNWFQSDTAIRNIRSVAENMGVDQMTIRPDFNLFRKMIAASIQEGFYARKALERASAVCTTCLSLIRFLCFKTAIEKAIPFVVFGLSPGQAPVATSVFKTNPKMVLKMQDAICLQLKEEVGDEIMAYFLESSHFRMQDRFPYSINPLSFIDYDEDAIIRTAESYGWIRPDDTDPNSTNCLLNALANDIHIKQYGYHPYAFEIAGLIREGAMTREEGLRRLSESADPEVLQRISRKLDMSYPENNEIVCAVLPE